MPPVHVATLILLVLAALLLGGCGGGGAALPVLPAAEPEPESTLLFRSWITASGAMNQLADGFRIHWGHYDPVLDDRAYTIFDELGAWRESDIGSVRTLRPADTPDFALFESFATNGTDDPMRISLRIHDDSTLGLTFNAQEVGRFVEVEPGALQPDAVGARITRIEIQLEDARFESPGQDRNGDGRWTDYFAFWQLYFYGYRVP